MMNKRQLYWCKLHYLVCQLNAKCAHFAAIPAAIYVCNGLDIWQVNFGDVCSCQRIFVNNEKVWSMTADQDGLHWLSRSKATMETLQHPFVNTSSVPLSNATHQDALLCSVLPERRYPPQILSVNESSVALNFSIRQSWRKNGCSSNTTASMPKSIYAVLYWSYNESVCIGSETCIVQVVNISSSDDYHEAKILKLQPGSTYSFQLIVKQQYLSAAFYALSPHTLLNTSCGVSSPVSRLTCSPQTPHSLLLTWEAPLVMNTRQLRYEVVFGETPHHVSSSQFLHSPTTEENLYQIRSYAVDCHEARNQYSVAEIRCSPFTAMQLSTLNVTSHTITVAWKPLPANQVVEVEVQWSLVTASFEEWTRSVPLDDDAGQDTITDLISGTGYMIRANVTYASCLSVLTNTISAQTFPGAPDAPTNVRVKGETPSGVLWWDAPTLRSGDRISIKEYVVEARNRSSPSNYRLLFGEWKKTYTVSARARRQWRIKDLMQYKWYEFRVYAVNERDVRGDTSSATANPYQFTLPEDNSRFKWIVIGSSVGTAAVILVVVLAVVCYKCSASRRRRRLKKKLPGKIAAIKIDYGTDMELAQIRHMTTLALAAAHHDGRINLPDNYMEKLPLFPRDKLTLDEMLGSGAFGEVYRGVAIDVKGGDAGVEYSVAVKTLKDGASDSEKCEFLMEAYFMSLFDHPNIISLLGVCLDNEPQFLILELMEGGDLLKYLRQARATQVMKAKLKLVDLIDICLDLAAGCQYLESQHFIHRDLAARNCLVSTKDYRSKDRVVKIGDFGLARDIYRNDYYHKEGEGLLPVRWMAPENLTLKIYTVQSDVWAFGVLMWEVMTFGQQPYPAFTNLEVIGFVNEGGRLEQPSSCPDILYTLMKECWDFEPNQRPSYQKVLELLRTCKVELPSISESTNESEPVTNHINYSLVTRGNDQDGSFSHATSAKYFDNRAFVFDEDDCSRSHSCYAGVSYTSPSYQSTGSATSDSVTTPHANGFLPSSTGSTVAVTDGDRTTSTNYAQLGFSPSREASVRNPVENGGPAKETEPRKEVDAFFTQQRAHKQGIDFSNDRKSFEENGSVSANEYLRAKNKEPSDNPRIQWDSADVFDTVSNYFNSPKLTTNDDLHETRLSGKKYIRELTKHWDNSLSTPAMNGGDLPRYADKPVTYV